MDPALDFRTLTLSTGVLVLALSAAMLSVRLTRRTYPGFGLWVLGSACAGGAMVVISALVALPEGALVSDGLSSLGLQLVVAGLERFMGRRRRPALHALVVAVAVAASALFLWGVPSYRARVLSGELLYLVQVVWCLGLLRGLSPALGGRNRLLEGSLVVQGLWSALRLAAIMGVGGVPSGLFYDVTFLVYPAVTAVMIYGLTDLDLQRLEADLRASVQEVHTLRGIIPICSYCKKIRDDQGSWQQVEAYVSEHTEAAFSHGICPRCYAEHWSEEAGEGGPPPPGRGGG
jgi:hypothetical protein